MELLQTPDSSHEVVGMFEKAWPWDFPLLHRWSQLQTPILLPITDCGTGSHSINIDLISNGF
jgi:hypothetical protein